MKAARFFREQLDLSQETMSQYLVVTRSQLAMYEAGKRELPIAASAKLAEIALFFEQKKAITAEETQILEKQDLEVKALLSHEAKELEYKLMKEQRTLDYILKKYNKNLQLHALALHLQKSNSLLAMVLQQQAVEGIEKYGLTTQTKQVLKLKSAESQLDYIKELMGV